MTTSFASRLCSLLLLTCSGLFAADKATNVILIIGDGMGPATVNAASFYGYGKPQALYIQHMPHLGWSDPSAASDWVTDSAAGMTALVTGQKTDNGALSVVAPKTGGDRAGQTLKTILEYAEEHGLSTGLISNSPMWDATPGACYAHVPKRGMKDEIVTQFFAPKYGDGVDLLIGPGLPEFTSAMVKSGKDLQEELKKHNYEWLPSAEQVASYDGKNSRVVSLFASEDYDQMPVVESAVRVLSRNRKGFFLMLESNNHGGDAKKNIERTVAMDKIVRALGEQAKSNTLIIVTADHSSYARLFGGVHDKEILPKFKATGEHTAEDVIVAAQGPGSEAVQGFFPNTHIFEVMMKAWGWKASAAGR